MSDCMTFPDTVEEFMEQYKVTDTDHVYSNGTEFVPIFRMKQWFATQHEIIRCKDCKFYTAHDYTGKLMCKRIGKGMILPKPEDYCSYAERITDEQTKD